MRPFLLHLLGNASLRRRLDQDGPQADVEFDSPGLDCGTARFVTLDATVQDGAIFKIRPAPARLEGRWIRFPPIMDIAPKAKQTGSFWDCARRSNGRMRQAPSCPAASGAESRLFANRRMCQ